MIAGFQYRWHFFSVQYLGTRVVRAIQQTIGKRVFFC
ncbi:Uncharacterised protein [Vibrio cholerae]|nr:Uncharacterised protein [Vibrio cholerae]